MLTSYCSTPVITMAYARSVTTLMIASRRRERAANPICEGLLDVALAVITGEHLVFRVSRVDQLASHMST
jgi:hypothetical protein